MRALFILLFCFALAGVSTAEAGDYIPAQTIRDNANYSGLKLRSHAALVYDERDAEIIIQQNSDETMPIASLSKLMTAMVILDAQLNMQEVITIDKQDTDRVRYSRSRFRSGMRFSRMDLLQIALAASENRAANALARTFPGGKKAFVNAMNQKARTLGLEKTRFVDPAGLANENVSTAKELLILVQAASDYEVIRDFTTQTRDSITERRSHRQINFGNTNRLVSRKSWPIRLSKTGFTREAGNCLVMQTMINKRPVTVILLESWGKLSKYGDSNRIRKWLIRTERIVRKKNKRRV